MIVRLVAVSAVLSLALTFSIQALAWKGMGGGGGGTNGSSFDIDEGKGLIALDRDALQTLVQGQLSNRYREFPQLPFVVANPLKRKFWNLSLTPLNQACRTTSISGANPEIAGCQTSREVRISKSWWDKAGARDRAALVVHEALLAYFENTPFDSENVRPLVRALFGPGGASVVRDSFVTSQFGTLALDSEIAQLGLAHAEIRQELCSAKPVFISDWIVRKSGDFFATVFLMANSMKAAYRPNDTFCTDGVPVADSMLIDYWMNRHPLPLEWMATADPLDDLVQLFLAP